MRDAAERLYERVLVLRCQAGDPAALSELIARYSPRLRFYLRKLAGEATADDLLQDVWVDVFAKATRLHDPAAFGGWVYRIARDKAYRELTRRRVPTVSIGDEPALEADALEDSWSAADIENVRAALDELAPEHREVLVLRFVEQMSYEQIASVIDRPVGTARSRLHYAKRALRDVMRGLVRKDRTP
jgi:RNA polymerase sigma-70 factor (ECF subfamily)